MPSTKVQPLLTCDRRGSDLCCVLPSPPLPVNTREIFLEMEKDGRPNPFGRLFLQLSEKRRAGDKNMPPRNFGGAYFGITPNCNIDFPYRPDAFRLNKQNEEKRFRSCWTPFSFIHGLLPHKNISYSFFLLAKKDSNSVPSPPHRIDFLRRQFTLNLR